MQGKFIQKLHTSPLWLVVVTAIILSEVLTTFFSTVVSTLLWNNVPHEVLVIGFIDAFIVSLIVVIITIHFLKQVSKLTFLHDALELKVRERTADLSELNIQLQKEIAERKKYEKQIINLAYYDNLTSLPNRNLFEELLKKTLLMNERQKTRAALLFIDVDNFKRINDTLGHEAGDQLLRSIADRLHGSMRKSDIITHQRGRDVYARLGGDEFTVLLTTIKEFEDAAKVARRVLNHLATPFIVNGHELIITASIGIAIYPDDGQDAITVLKNADAAMYHAKERGRNNYQYYRQFMNAAALERLNMEGDLAKALERDEFILHYQPQVDIATGRITGVEALIRWIHPEQGMISPLEFIPVAEQTGLIIPISNWVLETACLQASIWQEEGMSDLALSVNLTSHQFQQKDFIDFTCDILNITGLKPESLMLEITENTLMKDTELSFANLHALSKVGVRLVIDDFGTGYSSLSYLKRFPIHAIKIDRSFVKDIHTDQENAAISDAIISMAHSLKMKVVAEGVESEEQRIVLGERGCDEMQGYLFSRPLPVKDMSRLLAGTLDNVVLC